MKRTAWRPKLVNNGCVLLVLVGLDKQQGQPCAHSHSTKMFLASKPYGIKKKCPKQAVPNFIQFLIFSRASGRPTSVVSSELPECYFRLGHFCRFLDEQLHNTHWKMSLLTCWKNWSLVQWYHCRRQLFWRRTSGLCRSCGLRLAGCNWKNHRINVVYLQSCYNMPPKNFWEPCFKFTIPCWRMGKFQIAGGQPVSICCRKKLRAMHASDFKPIANLRLLYKVFAYLILGRIEHTLDTYQPEEQHGFRSKYRLEKHLLTANLFLDKATAHGIPVWLVSLDLSKAFDRVH